MLKILVLNTHIFELNYSYHFYILYKKYINFYFQSKLVDKLLAKL